MSRRRNIPDDMNALRGREIASRSTDGQIQVCPDSLRCQLHLRGLTTSDSNALEATFSFSIHALNEKAERQMLAETFLGQRTTATADDVANHFSVPLRHALGGRVSNQPAGHWLDPACKPELIELLRSAARPVAFACGVELLPPFDLSLESPTLERARLEQMQRELVERRAAGQVEHVQRAAELLKQFQSLRETMPGLSPGQLLERVNPSDRGSMLESLMLASGQSQQTLWAVAGPNLLRIDVRSASPRIDLIPLPSDLGPLRSVQPADIAGASRLLLGAQKGVIEIDPARPDDATRYLNPDMSSQLGFNSVAVAGDMIFATHAEAGLVGWRIGQTDKPAIVRSTMGAGRTGNPEGSSTQSAPERSDPNPSPAAALSETQFSIAPNHPGSSTSLRSPGAGAYGPRNATALDEHRLLYSAAGQLLLLDCSGTPNPVGDGPSTIILIAPDRDRIAIVRADGFVQWLDRQTLAAHPGSHRAGNLCAAAPLAWLGTMRLLLASEAGPVLCIGAEDSLMTQYSSAHRGLRAIAATADLIAALSGDRQRIVVWKTWDPARPAHELHVSSIARHRVADVCFA
jgi:hypothetical protein